MSKTITVKLTLPQARALLRALDIYEQELSMCQENGRSRRDANESLAVENASRVLAVAVNKAEGRA